MSDGDETVDLFERWQQSANRQIEMQGRYAQTFAAMQFADLPLPAEVAVDLSGLTIRYKLRGCNGSVSVHFCPIKGQYWWRRTSETGHELKMGWGALPQCVDVIKAFIRKVGV